MVAVNHLYELIVHYRISGSKEHISKSFVFEKLMGELQENDMKLLSIYEVHKLSEVVHLEHKKKAEVWSEPKYDDIDATASWCEFSSTAAAVGSYSRLNIKLFNQSRLSDSERGLVARPERLTYVAG